MVSHSPTKDHGRHCNRFITHRSWRKFTTAGLKVPHVEVKAMQRQELGHMALLRSWVECFGVLGQRLGWSIQTEKSRVLVSSSGALSKRHLSGSPWEVGDFVTGPFGP